MAKKEMTKSEQVADAKEIAALSKLLIREFNKDEEKTGKLAWNLSIDLDNPTEIKEWISTGSTLLDYNISNKPDGGIPVGKLTEISGEEASGKSLMAAHILANTQKRGGLAVLADSENAYNPEFGAQVGVDNDKLVYLQPRTIEETGEAIEKVILLTRQKAKDKLVTIVWDSVAGTPSQAEIEGTFDPNDRIGVTAKALAKMMRKLTQTLGKERICLVFTNQLKTKIGVMYGDPMTTPGGKAIPYHASVRIRLTRSTLDKSENEGDQLEALGVNTICKVVKNRCGPPLRKCRFLISFARGIEDVDSWFDHLHEMGVIKKSGGYCTLPEAFGEEKFREKAWAELVSKNRDIILEVLKKHMVVKFGEKPKNMDMDPESLMDAEAVADELTKPE
jgi:recombination protein RecA